ncbi:MAG: hypothetical protein MZU97_09835 [Bacillus subtilis]|nr:hypothetical protein [Bacillus subtilis]
MNNLKVGFATTNPAIWFFAGGSTKPTYDAEVGTLEFITNRSDHFENPSYSIQWFVQHIGL